MAVSIEDIEILEGHFDDRYVMQNECNEIQLNNNRKFANDDKRIDAVVNTLNIITKLGWVAVSAIIGEVALSLLSLLKGV